MTSPISVLIADDEPLARRRLQLALAQMGDVRFVGFARDGDEAVEAIRAKTPDVVLLDVKMPLRDGFEIADALNGDGPEIVFVTAYDHYAVRAFEARAVDYLLKPVDFERLSQALQRARSARAARSAQSRVQELTEVVEVLRSESRAPPEKRFEKEFWIKDRGQWLRVPVDSIDWIEAERDYMRLHCGARSHLLRATMAGLEEQLDPEEWTRIHRSVLVRRARVTAVRRTPSGGLMVRMASGAETPVGRAYMHVVLRDLHGQGRPATS
jgi:DNA-binding LytR/AlgR family response regulator